MAVAPPDLVERFRSDVLALTGDGRGRLGIAVSGGADSLALLLLAHAARPGEIEAATVDHRLRAESADEAAFVSRLCAGLDVPHATLAGDAPIYGNVQSEARILRYRLLGLWAEQKNIAHVLTAHHADDQAETLIMRLQRGSGVAGLAGIRAATRIGTLSVLRPLLGWTRNELRSVVHAAGLTPLEDPSNSDRRYDRARLRQQLADTDWLDPAHLARSAGALADADAALEWATGRLYGERARVEGSAIRLDLADLPDELRRRLVIRVLATLTPGAAPRGSQLQRLIATLEGGGVATLAGVRGKGGGTWTFTAASPRRT